MFELVDSCRETCRNRLTFDRHTPVAREADHTDDLVVGVANRQLRRNAPHRIVRPIPLELQVAQQRPAGSQNLLVLIGGNPAIVAGADVARTLTDRIGHALESVASDERIVHGHVMAFRVLDKERNVLGLVEE